MGVEGGEERFLEGNGWRGVVVFRKGKGWRWCLGFFCILGVFGRFFGGKWCV